MLCVTYYGEVYGMNKHGFGRHSQRGSPLSINNIAQKEKEGFFVKCLQTAQT